MPRFYCPIELIPGTLLELPAGAARHVQVLRLQPGAHLTLFNGQPGAAGEPSGEFAATVTHMGRSNVQVQVGDWISAQREPSRRIHLAVGMPANERMDWLVEKATELGVASIQPLLTQRTVLRLAGERADKKQAHWQSVAVAACEQCGGNCVPVIHPVLTLPAWLASASSLPSQRLLLSLNAGALALRTAASTAPDVTFLSGPEGGLSDAEEAAAARVGFAPVTLSTRTLRAETAALVALAALLL